MTRSKVWPAGCDWLNAEIANTKMRASGRMSFIRVGCGQALCAMDRAKTRPDRRHRRASRVKEVGSMVRHRPQRPVFPGKAQAIDAADTIAGDAYHTCA